MRYFLVLLSACLLGGLHSLLRHHRAVISAKYRSIWGGNRLESVKIGRVHHQQCPCRGCKQSAVVLCVVASDEDFGADDDPFVGLQSDKIVDDLDFLVEDEIDDDSEEDDDDDELQDVVDRSSTLEEEENADDEEEDDDMSEETNAKILMEKKKKILQIESQFEDDPLKANSPTRDWDPPVDPYSSWYIAISDIVDSSKRSDAWMHHLQWARRSALLPNATAKVDFEYTRLSDDCMFPRGQIIGFRGNDSSDIVALLNDEPLFNHGGVNPWKLYQLHFKPNAQLVTPKNQNIFIGLNEKKTKMKSKAKSDDDDDDEMSVYGLEPNQVEYYLSSERTVIFGSLTPIDFGKDNNNANGIMVVHNAPSGKDAARFISNDPVIKKSPKYYSSSVLSYINEQDVDGLHHLMARSFYEKTILDTIHFNDPEDILSEVLPTLPSLPHHHEKNIKLLELLKEHKISYKYTRFDVNDRYGDVADSERAKSFNEGLDVFQTARLQSPSDLYADAELSDSMAEESESFGGEE